MKFTDPVAAEAAFYTAFAELNLAGMREVWIDSADASCIHPGAALLQGIEGIMASWAAIFDNNQAPKVEPRLVQASTDRNLAVHTVAESISAGAGESTALVMATNVYARTEDGSWRMLAHHASLPLVESDQDAGQQHPSPLH